MESAPLINGSPYQTIADSLYEQFGDATPAYAYYLNLTMCSDNVTGVNIASKIQTMNAPAWVKAEAQFVINRAGLVGAPVSLTLTTATNQTIDLSQPMGQTTVVYFWGGSASMNDLNVLNSIKDNVPAGVRWMFVALNSPSPTISSVLANTPITGVQCFEPVNLSGWVPQILFLQATPVCLRFQAQWSSLWIRTSSVDSGTLSALQVNRAVMNHPKLLFVYTAVLAATLAAPRTLAQGCQAPVSSQNTTIQYPGPFTPTYIGGSGSGNWQFIIPKYTNWNLANGSPAGTELPNGQWVTSWTPPVSNSTTTYQFNVAHLGSGSLAVATSPSYTLTVLAPTNGLTFNSVSGWPASAPAGSQISFSVSVTNSGTTTWGPGYTIAAMTDNAGTPIVSVPINAAVGATLPTVTFTFTLTTTVQNNYQCFLEGSQSAGSLFPPVEVLPLLNVILGVPVVSPPFTATA